jgi:GxxExxY protein
MPVTLPRPIAAIPQEEYHAIHERLVGHSIDIQNDLGRLLPEAAYQNELAARCSADGLPAERELRIQVTHGSFTKNYFIDLLLCGSTIVEVKASSANTPAHKAQTLNYLMLAGTHHGSLVNFRPTRVSHSFVSTRLNHGKRVTFLVHRQNWPVNPAHKAVDQAVCDFCSDVGLALDTQLYREAIASLAQLPTHLVTILSGRTKTTIAHQEMLMVDDKSALAVSSLTALADYRSHLRRLLSATDLAGISWINLTLGEIRLEHISRP